MSERVSAQVLRNIVKSTCGFPIDGDFSATHEGLAGRMNDDAVGFAARAFNLFNAGLDAFDVVRVDT